MKRLVAITSMMLICLLGSAFLPGCGGTRGQAQAYMKKGDETVLVIEKDSKTLVAKTNQTFSDLYKAIDAGKTPDAGAFEEDSQEIEALAEKMLDTASDAKAEYEKIIVLKGVPDYVNYAEAKVKVIDANVKGLKELQTFLGQQEEKLTVKPFDPVAFQIAVVQFSDSLDKLGQETDKLQKTAEDLKKEKEL
jgi:uncharacterized protein YoxC